METIGVRCAQRKKIYSVLAEMESVECFIDHGNF